ncbi:hypothetical protein MRX96_012525 [Rhipicephalus microplus]
MVLVARVRPAVRGAGLASALAEPIADEDVMELKPLGGGAARPPLRRHSFFNHVPPRPTVAPLSPRKSIATFATTWNERDEEEEADGVNERQGSRRGHSRQNSLRPDVGQVSPPTAEPSCVREGREVASSHL